MVTAEIDLYKYGETGPSGESGTFLWTAPIKVQFRARVTSGAPVSFLWDFGDGASASTDRSPIHTYNYYGTYRVVLTVTDPYGTYVEPFFNVVLGKLDFTSSAVEGTSPLTVNFQDTSVAPAGCYFTGHAWDFGDLAGATGISDPTHVYTHNGVYSVSINAYLTKA